MKISLIIPCYNVEKYLGECLDSVLTAAAKLQSETNGETNQIEVICVDDGSTDGTGRMLDEFKTRIQESECNCSPVIIHQPNAGEGAARNAGLEAMTGDWFTFLDSDDILNENALQVIHAWLKDDPCDLTSSRLCWFQDGTKVVWPTSTSTGLSRIETNELIPDEAIHLGVCSTVYNAERFRHLRFTKHIVGADLVFTAKCLTLANSIAFADNLFYGYRQRTGSMVHRALDERKMLHRISYLKEIMSVLSTSGKKINKRFARTRSSVWLEGLPYDIWHMTDSRSTVWREWFDSLKCAKNINFLTARQKLIAAALNKTESPFFAYFVCALPYLLKCRFATVKKMFA